MPGLSGDSFLKGVNTGSAMFSRIMKPILAREQMAQRKKMQEAQLAQQWQSHLDNLAVRKMQEARLGEMIPLQRMIALENLKKLQLENDPTAQVKYFEQLLGASNNKSSDNTTNLSGQGMFPLEENASSNPGNNFDLMAIKNDMSPHGLALRSVLEKKFPSMFKEVNRPYQGAARNALDLERLKKEYGEGSEVYQNAKAEQEANIQGKRDLSLIRDRTISGLKPGERWIKDENTGERIGIQHTLNEKERNAEEGRAMFNELYPIVYKGAAPFSGEGSIRKLEEAAANYKTDPNARKMFDDFLLAEKALTATVVNEAATLNAGKTNQTYRQLRESLIADDIPRKIKSLIKQYQIPASANLKSALSFQKLLNEATTNSRKMVPATRDLYFSPELQNKKSQQQELSTPKSVIVINPEGKRFETTEENAAHLPEGWKRG